MPKMRSTMGCSDDEDVRKICVVCLVVRYDVGDPATARGISLVYDDKSKTLSMSLRLN
jgi:hypothetical protein